MRGKQTALPGAPAISSEKVGYWLTPPKLMASLREEFDFNFDACPFPRESGFDGLVEEWGTRTYANPPFRGGVLKWARKAIAEAKTGKLVVLMVPCNRIDHLIEPMLAAGAELRVVPVRWENPAGKPTRLMQAGALFILRPTGVS